MIYGHYLGVRGLSVAVPPSRHRPLLGLFCTCLDNSEPPVPSDTESGEMTEESM